MDLLNWKILVKAVKLTHSLIHDFETISDSKELQTTTEIWLLKDFNPFLNKPWFLHVCMSLLKTLWEHEKLLVTSNFSFSNSVFYPFGDPSAIFIKFEIVICIFIQFGNLSFGKGLRYKLHRKHCGKR